MQMPCSQLFASHVMDDVSTLTYNALVTGLEPLAEFPKFAHATAAPDSATGAS